MAKRSKFVTGKESKDHPNRPDYVKVVDDEEAEKCDFVVCKPVKDGPPSITDSFIEKCYMCEGEVWVSPRSPKKPARLCWNCMHEIEKSTVQ